MAFEITMNDVPESAFGGDLDAGNYTIRLMAAPELTETKGEGGKSKMPMLNARFEVLEGPAKGREQVLRYVLGVEVVDGKQKFTPGVVNIKRDIKNATGQEMPEGFRLSDKNAVKWYGTKMKDQLVNLNARKYKPRGWKDGEDLSTSYSITGKATIGQNAGAAHTAMTALATTGATVADDTAGDDEEFT